MRMTLSQNAALVKIERQDTGQGVTLRAVTAEAMVRRGLLVRLPGGRYTKA